VGQAEEAKAKKQAYEDSRPGRVPDGVGVITVNQVPERDNAFPGLLSRHYYHSHLTNIMYAGWTAADAARVESTTGRPYTTPDHHRLYAVARRGFPMNPIEVRRLAQLVMNGHTNSADRADSYRLITELRRISIRMIPERRDRSMHEVASDSGLPANFAPPFPRGHAIWDHNTIPRPPVEGRLGISMPAPDAGLDIELWAQYVTLHARPGGPNPFVGLAFNYAYQVHYCTFFGYALSHILGPPSSHARSVFVHHFSCLMAIPHRYLEYVQDWAKLHDQPPQFPSPGPNITVTRMNWASESADTMTMDNVARVLLDNRIPVPWIDHAYTFGLHYLNHHLGHTTAAQSTLEAVDDMHIVNLSVWGVPPAISEWDRLHTVAEHDMLRLYRVLENKERRDIYCTDDSPAWLCVGEDPHFEQVRTHRRETDP
jgi:hypothetical protein